MERIEVLTQPRLDTRQGFGARHEAQQPAREPMQPLGDGIVGTRNPYELGELPLELRLLLAQHLDLPLDQRDGRAAARMRQLQSREQSLVALEELGMALQVSGDALFFAVRRGKAASLSCRHIALDLDVPLE